MSSDLLYECGLRPRQIMMLLDVSQSTYYRWRAGYPMPRAAWLVLRSVAQGLPVLPSRSDMWDGYRFAVDGSLRRPNDYPLYPGDLWLYEFLMINGEIRRMARAHGVEDLALVP